MSHSVSVKNWSAVSVCFRAPLTRVCPLHCDGCPPMQCPVWRPRCASFRRTPDLYGTGVGAGWRVKRELVVTRLYLQCTIIIRRTVGIAVCLFYYVLCWDRDSPHLQPSRARSVLSVYAVCVRVCVCVWGGPPITWFISGRKYPHIN